jgi:hypothetical protein
MTNEFAPMAGAEENSGGNSIGRPKKNRELLIGRAGRDAIEREDIARESLRWQRRKQTIERFRRD